MNRAWLPAIALVLALTGCPPPPPPPQLDDSGGIVATRPVAAGSFSWDPIAGADQYVVVVSAGDAVWVWEGRANAVDMPTVAGDVEPPTMGTEVRWFVIAVDGAGSTLAASAVAATSAS